MSDPAPSGWLQRTGQVLLAAAALVAAFFFFSRWGINAAALGARDAGWALFLSFANVLALYASVAIAAVSACLAVVGVLTRRAWGVYLWALLAALVPVLYLAVWGARGR